MSHISAASVARLTTIPASLLARLLASLLVMALVACGDAPSTQLDAAVDVSPADDSTPAGPFGVAIEASALTGNAPLRIDFSAKLTPPDGAPDDWTSELRYRWTVDDAPAGNENTFSFDFFRAGAASIALTVDWPEADQTERAVVIVRVRGCADLRFEDFAIAEPTDVPPGGTLTVLRGRLVNDGDSVEGPFEIAVGLAATEFWDPASGVLTSTMIVDGIGARESPTGTIDLAGRSFTVPEDATIGTFAAFLVADPAGAVNECQKANNALAGTGVIEIDPDAARRADLVIDNIDIPEGRVVKQGDDLNYSFRLRNIGDAESRQFRYGFWLSRDQVLSPETDIPVADPNNQASRVQNLPPAGALGFLKTWRVPEDLPDGEWWLIGKVDATETVFEHDEDNNTGVSAFPVTMRFVEPTCSDLDVSETDALSVDTTTSYWGGSVRAIVTVRNPGTVATEAGWTLRAYLSQQSSLNPSTARIVATVTGGAIEPGSFERFELIIPITSDLPVFPHYLGLRVDPLGIVAECDEGNNSRIFATPIQIEALARVDLVASNLVYHPETVVAGTGFRAEWRVANTGTSAATAFRAVIAISATNVFSTEAFADGRAVIVDRLTIPGLAAGASVDLIRPVPVPLSLDHRVASWHVAAIADPDRLIGADINPGNNLIRAPRNLVVTGAEGGCFEDDFEPNDSLMQAAVLAAGTTSGLGACGNADWYAIAVAAGESLYVDINARPIISTPALPAELDIELRDPQGNVVARHGLASPHRLVSFLAPESGLHTLFIRGRTANARATYDVTVTPRPPTDGVDLAVAGLALDPAVGFPGGRLAIRLTTANLGRTMAGPHNLGVGLRRPAGVDGGDIDLGVVAVPALAAQGSRETTATFDLPTTLDGGAWQVIVTADPADTLAEADRDNNTVTAAPFMVDLARTCLGDRFEPNDTPSFATPARTDIGSQRFDDAIVCPGQEDWYTIELAPDRSLRAEIRHDFDPARGRVRLALIDPDGRAVLAETLVSGSGAVDLPHNWLAGRWFLRVTHGDVTSGLPITYSLTLSTATSAPAARCTADDREPDNDLGAAVPLGCASVSPTLCRMDVDHYRITATTGAALTATLNHPDGNLRMSLLSADGLRVLAQRQGNGSLNHTPTTSDNLILKVDSRVGPTLLNRFDYTLAVTGIQAPDLAVTTFLSESSQIEPGEELAIAFDVANTCSIAAPSFATGIHLSIDAMPSPDDLELVHFPSPLGLGSGTTTSFDDKVRIPASTPPGDYFLLAWADIGESIVEPDRRNNLAVLPLRVRAPCLPDRFETNDSPTTATRVTAGVEANLSLCAGDFDWFEIQVPAGTQLRAAIRFAHRDGDLDLRVYDPVQGTTVPIAAATSRNDDEALTIDVPLATRLLVRVNGYLGATAPYDLELELTPQ